MTDSLADCYAESGGGQINLFLMEVKNDVLVCRDLREEHQDESRFAVIGSLGTERDVVEKLLFHICTGIRELDNVVVISTENMRSDRVVILDLALRVVVDEGGDIDRTQPRLADLRLAENVM